MSIIFASSVTQRGYTWTAWKTVQTNKNLLIQYDDDGVVYTIYGYDGPEVHVCQIYKGNVPDPLLATYSQTQNNSDKTDFETNFKSTANTSIAPRTSTGMPRATSEKSDLSRTNFYSFNWCDKTTWYMASTYVSAETLVDAGDHLNYQAAHTVLIDTYHGKVTLEDYLKDSQGGNYRVVVKVNGIQKTEQDPHLGTGGDYTVNYGTGKVTFLVANLLTDVVTANYWYPTTSVFTIAPAAGKILTMTLAECQLATDVVMKDSVYFQVYGYVQVFAPSLWAGNGGPYPTNTKIPIQTFCYKTISDFMNDSMRAYPSYPALSASNWRGLSQPSIVLDWDYVTSTALSYKSGMEIRCYLQHDAVFGGTFATVTFYCTSQAES